MCCESGTAVTTGVLVVIDVAILLSNERVKVAIIVNIDKSRSAVISNIHTVERIVQDWEKLPPSVKRYFSSTSEEELKRWLSLTQLRYDVPLKVSPEDLKIKRPDFGKLKEKLQELEMKSLLKEVERLEKNHSVRQRSLF